MTKSIVDIIKKYANEYAGKLLKPVDTRMKNEELITMLAYLAYIDRKDSVKAGDYLNIFVRNQRINARFGTKSNITNRLIEISENNDPVFCDALQDVKDFIEKIRILCGSNFEDFNRMIGLTKKNTKGRTNQNFYLLWIALAHIDFKRIHDKKDMIFCKIKDMVLLSQYIKDDNFDINDYIRKLSDI